MCRQTCISNRYEVRQPISFRDCTRDVTERLGGLTSGNPRDHFISQRINGVNAGPILQGYVNPSAITRWPNAMGQFSGRNCCHQLRLVSSRVNFDDVFSSNGNVSELTVLISNDVHMICDGTGVQGR